MADATRATDVTWKDEPDAHDYPAAAAYLSLLTTTEDAAAIIERLTTTPVMHQKAKDILRAAGLPLLPPDDPSVRSDLAKVKQGHPLSPVLLVRGDLRSGRAMQIADGYHRVCASYHTSEDTDVPCQLVDLDLR